MFPGKKHAEQRPTGTSTIAQLTNNVSNDDIRKA